MHICDSGRHHIERLSSRADELEINRHRSIPVVDEGLLSKFRSREEFSFLLVRGCPEKRGHNFDTTTQNVSFRFSQRTIWKETEKLNPKCTHSARTAHTHNPLSCRRTLRSQLNVARGARTVPTGGIVLSNPSRDGGSAKAQWSEYMPRSAMLRRLALTRSLHSAKWERSDGIMEKLKVLSWNIWPHKPATPVILSGSQTWGQGALQQAFDFTWRIFKQIVLK